MLGDPILTSLKKDQCFLQSVLRESEKDDGLEIDDVEDLPCCNTGDHYMSSMTRVRIRGRTGDDDGAGGKRTRKPFCKSLLMKRQPACIARRNAYRCDPAFKNETAGYESVIPSLSEFAKERLPFPSCLHASSQLIILEDLQPHGFRMADRLKGLDLQHSKLAFRALGKFHGMSLAMKHVNRPGFDKVKSQCQELIFVPEAEAVFGASVENALNMALMSLEDYRGVGDSAIEEAVHNLRFLKGSVFRRLVATAECREPLSVICHGDFWINNMLFRYKDDEPEEIKFVDLQVMRYASPATDILHFLNTSLQPNVFDYYQDELIASYHESLDRTLMELAPSAPTVTLEQITNEIIDCALYGLLMGFLLMPVVTSDEENTINLDGISGHVTTEKFVESARDYLTPLYNERIKNLVLHYINRGFL